MALNFPVNPSVGQTYQTGSSATYIFNGSFWDLSRNIPINIISASHSPTALTASNAINAEEVVRISGTTPESLISGALWYNTSGSELYVETALTGSGNTWQIATNRVKTYITGSQPADTKIGDLWFDTSANELYVDTTGKETFQLLLTGSAGYKNISKISTTGYGGIILVAEGKVYMIKGNDGNYQTFTGALSPSIFNTGLRRGIINTYEIPFPNEINGTVTDAGSYGNSAYALFANGDLYTWGQNTNGQLGTGDTVDRFYPVQVQTDVVEVYPPQGENEPSQIRLLIKKTDGKIYGCGSNAYGELGLGDSINRNSFVELPWIGRNPLSVWNLGTTNGNIFAQLANVQIWVSGGNNFGQLGLGVGNTTTSLFAQQAPLWFGAVGGTNKRIIQMFAGHRSITGSDEFGFTNMMLLREPSTGVTDIFGAGYNAYGQLGTGNRTNSQVPIGPIGAFVASVRKMVYQGGAVGSVYVVTTSGTTWMWGYNGQGQLGNTSTTDVLTPAQRVGILDNPLDIVAQPQGLFTFPFEISSPLVRSSTNGLYYSAGYNAQGNLGRGIADSSSNEWGVVRLPSDVVIKFLGTLQTQAGGDTTIAIDTRNRIWAWGWNTQQQIDRQSTATVFAPIQIGPLALRR